jgi:hypothetical protein
LVIANEKAQRGTLSGLPLLPEVIHCAATALLRKHPNQKLRIATQNDDQGGTSYDGDF